MSLMIFQKIYNQVDCYLYQSLNYFQSFNYPFLQPNLIILGLNKSKKLQINFPLSSKHYCTKLQHIINFLSFRARALQIITIMSIKQRLKKVKLFLPVSTQLIIWHLFIISYMLVDLILTVIVNCFQHGTSRTVLFQVINNILPVILIIDILISFNTGFIKNGKIILNRKAANIEYLNTVYFYCDVIALITSFLQIIFQNTFMKQITVFHYLIFIKLTTLYFLDSLFKKYVIKSFNALLLYEVCKNFLILAIVCHIIGSFYFYIDVLMYQAGWYGTNQLWIFSSYAFNNIYTSDFWIQYTYSYYVACVTLSGTAYGDIIPLNPHENLYIFCCFVLPMLIYSYVYSSIFQALFNRRGMTSQIRRYKFLAKQYLKALGVTDRVLNKVLTYLEFTHKKNMIVQTDFIQGLAPTIKSQYLHTILEGKFQYSCFNQVLQISQLDTAYLKDHLINLIRQQYFPERFPLIDSQKLKIYYINSGKVVEVVQLNQEKKLSKPLPKFNHVAKTAFFTNQIPFKKFSYQSNSFVMAHSICYKEFKKLAKQKMPTFNEAFCYLQWKILDERQYQLMNEKCFFCDDISHTIKDCPHLNIQKQSLGHTKKQLKQERCKFNRDQLVKNQLSKRPNLQKKQSLLRKISNSSIDIDLILYKKSSKIYQSKKENFRFNEMNFPKDSQISEFRNYLQQTQKLDFIQERSFKNVDKHHKEVDKVCIWDRFYLERNIIA